MPLTKQRVESQVQAILALLEGDLKGRPQEEQVRELINNRGFYPTAVAKALRISGKKIAAMLKPLTEAAPPPPPGELAPVAKAQDEEYHEELREMVRDARRPIIEREIEDSAWFHNLCQIVGKNVTLRLWGHAGLDQMKAENWTESAAAILARFDGLITYAQDAGQMQTLKAHLLSYQLAYDTLKGRLQKLEGLYELACALMPEDARRKALTVLALRGAQAM